MERLDRCWSKILCWWKMEKNDLPAMGPKHWLPAIDELQPPSIVNCLFFWSVVRDVPVHQSLTAVCKDDLVRIGLNDDCPVTISTMNKKSIKKYSHIMILDNYFVQEIIYLCYFFYDWCLKMLRMNEIKCCFFTMVFKNVNSIIFYTTPVKI